MPNARRQSHRISARRRDCRDREPWRSSAPPRIQATEALDIASRLSKEGAGGGSTIEEIYNLERYIDAQHSGPGLGWFRVVQPPVEAREVIADGKLAVILGIETSDLFDCFLTPRDGFEACPAESVRAVLDRYWEMGTRAIFPTHKFDSAFSAGDGDRNVGQIGSFINGGHNSNFVETCPDSPRVF
ncbi:MAG: hypothetical protein GY811_22555 [Myxococcales bacterium]|nr:hypothetical protein [Myxococcales bacterium]